jgi:Cu/Ag efflux protein CusF
MPNKLNSSLSRLPLLLLCTLLAFSSACNRGISERGTPNSSSGTKRYALRGKVISVDKNAGTASLDNQPIAGFMDEMLMSYTSKPPADINQLQPGDSITADVVVQPDNSYWLENVKVTGHSQTAAPHPAN